jgi:hypothetical protein
MNRKKSVTKKGSLKTEPEGFSEEGKKEGRKITRYKSDPRSFSKSSKEKQVISQHNKTRTITCSCT